MSTNFTTRAQEGIIPPGLSAQGVLGDLADWLTIGSPDACSGAMATGQDILALALKHVGEPYAHVVVPKDNPKWKGPWDCAEFASWCVYQASRRLYGCTAVSNPSTADAYTGAWWDDAQARGRLVSVTEGIGTVGAMLLRRPQTRGAMGHIAISDGRGGTIEARGKAYGVCRASANYRAWDTAVLVPWVDYAASTIDHVPPTIVFKFGHPAGKDATVAKIQRALKQAGIDPGPVDGVYGPHTASAVAAFQARFGVTQDGEVGPVTWALLFS